MNLTAEDLASGVLRDRGKVGASLADVDPMNLDSSVSIWIFNYSFLELSTYAWQLTFYLHRHLSKVWIWILFMCVFSQVRFDSVGGLSNHIHALKEMVVFPLLYPEIFERFKIQPPR